MRQRGAALLIMVMIMGLGATWYLVSQLNAESGGLDAVRKNRNAEVLNRAKQALISYIAMRAAQTGENNPGALPCPEAAAYYGDPAQEGITASNCSLPKVGRFPWRTLGLDKLVDSTGEPLWYVVGPGWAYTSGFNTTINSNSTGQLTVDGRANDAVALIIAPGPAFSVPAATGCAAWNQTRPTTGTLDWRNYLECENATNPADSVFVTTGTSATFNDQVVRITVADIMPAIEAAIASRIEREILPALQTVYTPATWGFSGSNPVLPFAAPFASPGSGVGTSNYQGAIATYAGLLPFNQTQDCTVSAADPRCTTGFLSYSKSGETKTGGSGDIYLASSCTWQSDVFVCTGEYSAPSISLTLSVDVTNVAMGLRALDTSKITCSAVDDAGLGDPEKPVTCSASASLQSNGSARITVATSALPDVASSGWNTRASYVIKIQRAAIGDHALLSTTNATTGWFARNEWYRLVYYAVAASNTAGKVATERSCTATPVDCLSVTNISSTKSALMVLAGRSVNGSSRPGATLADYLEFGNANGAYETQSVSPVGSMIYADTGSADAYNVAVTSLAAGASLQFKATNANTGASTLNTTATGARGLVNADGSNLAPGTIQANAAIQVTWDGTQFLLSKRPFNDRFAALASN